MITEICINQHFNKTLLFFRRIPTDHQEEEEGCWCLRDKLLNIWNFFLLYIIYYDIWDLSGVYKGKGTESQN